MSKIIKLEIDTPTRAEIKEIIKKDERYRVRKRASAILYKHQDYKVTEIAKLLEVRTEAIYEWISKYKREGIASFYDKKGKGRKRIVKDSELVKVKELAINSPSIPMTNAKIREKLNIYISDSTLKNYLKKTKIDLYTSQKDST